MNWKQFKEHVDSELAARNINDDEVRINWADISMCDEPVVTVTQGSDYRIETVTQGSDYKIEMKVSDD